MKLVQNYLPDTECIICKKKKKSIECIIGCPLNIFAFIKWEGVPHNYFQKNFLVFPANKIERRFLPLFELDISVYQFHYTITNEVFLFEHFNINLSYLKTRGN